MARLPVHSERCIPSGAFRAAHSERRIPSGAFRVGGFEGAVRHGVHRFGGAAGTGEVDRYHADRPDPVTNASGPL